MNNGVVKLFRWIFETLDAIVDIFEHTVVNTVSALSPWLAPLAPAILVYFGLTQILNFPIYVAIPIAAVIEFIGLSSVSTGMKFWAHNKRYTAHQYKVPLWIPISTFVFYLSAVLTLNVILDVSGDWRSLAAKIVLSLLSVPAVFVLASRSMLKDIKGEISSKYSKSGKRKVSENLPKEQERSESSLGKFPKDWRQLSDEQKYAVHIAEREQLVKAGLSEKTAYNWHQYSEELFGDNGR